MFHVGDRVVYGIHGVCDIVTQEEKIVDRKPVVYLVLEPLGQLGSRYLVPMHNVVAMGKIRKLLSREEAEQLLESDAVRADSWIQDENRRKQTYRELIGSADREKLMAMVHTLYAHRQQQTGAGRKMHLCDDNFLRDAEKLLAGEISVVMEMEPDAARQYIRQKLKG